MSDPNYQELSIYFQRTLSKAMCFLSVQCACRHNIAIPNPSKGCIRPRHPRGCWVIRRGEPLKTRCPACEEYFNPIHEQFLWQEVMQYHLDASTDWSELTHSNIVAADRVRHKGCEVERLDFRKRLRWKAMIRGGLLAGWKLTDRSVMVQDVGYSRQVEENETMEALDPDEVRKIAFQDNTEDAQAAESTEDGDDETSIGYELRRVSGGRMRAVSEEQPEGLNEGEVGEGGTFQITSSTDTSTTSSASEESSDFSNDETETGKFAPENDPGLEQNGQEETALSVGREGNITMPLEPTFAHVELDGSNSFQFADWLVAESGASEPVKQLSVRETPRNKPPGPPSVYQAPSEELLLQAGDIRKGTHENRTHKDEIRTRREYGDEDNPSDTDTEVPPHEHDMLAD
ncbi:hypothetical protein H072_8130 [Dactylellina haptotyla CBS 200.50]|uniref:Uncharacterized protein n=1 Tax=Dactylellina haptotyla (strain CBS 200.50) TaxID=1284197 RepID=S8A5L4_DACHA|nr:hypothetical protein H072_8130 [Dactylellina haptotyla CBS 200.50]